MPLASNAPATEAVTQSNATQSWGVQVTLSKPVTSRAYTLASITGLLAVMALVAVAVAVLVASFVAHRFATPVVRLTEASRRVAEGDLTARVNTEAESGTRIVACAVFEAAPALLPARAELVRLSCRASPHRSGRCCTVQLRATWQVRPGPWG